MTASMTSNQNPEVVITRLAFSDLNGWENDEHDVALNVFLTTSAAFFEHADQDAGARKISKSDARMYFEETFIPFLITDQRSPLITGYYEPEFVGSRHKTTRFTQPLYAAPPELQLEKPWLTRREIKDTEALVNRDLEIVWIEHAIDAFLLQVQGSGRIKLLDGSLVRVGYDARNGHQYRSIGKELIRRGVLERDAISAETIRDWAMANLEDCEALMLHNDSYVFFRELENLPADKGPLGTLKQPVTAGRSIAVDPSVIPLGAPVWLEKDGTDPISRLMIAQDTGSAIKGAQRADIFFGTGDLAGRSAGSIKDPGRLVVLLPAAQAGDLLNRLVQ